MVNISDAAAGLIHSLVAGSDLPASAGLRLSTDDEKHSLTMNLEAEPRQHDLVLEHQGSSLFVSPQAAPRLKNQTLHAQVAPRAAFFVDD
jgi:Fe-S cluster assembly iron-binding protein IscA